MDTLITIIIPCYNQAQFLPDAINSLKAQSISDWECIIVNDGSTDNTKEVAQDFCKQDSRIIYVEQKNQGLSAARNSGIERASGKFIQFLDSDDIILTKKFEYQLKQLEKNDQLSLSICNYYYCDQENTQKPVFEDSNFSPYLNSLSPLKDLILRWEDDLSIPIHCFLFDALFFKKNNIRFNTKLPNHEDWDCWLSIFFLNPNVFFINEELVAYRVHNTSMSVNTKKMHLGFLEAINQQKKKFKNYPDLIRFLLEKEKKIISKYRQEKKYIAHQKNKNNKFIKLYKKYMPWPIQSILRKPYK